MERKLNILFDFDIILQGFFKTESKTGIFWTEYRILDEFIKNHSDKFNFYAHCSCTEKFYNNTLIKAFPEFNSVKFVDIYAMNKLNVNKINFSIKYFKYKCKHSNFFGKIFYKIYPLVYKLIKTTLNKNVVVNCDLSFIDYYQSILGTTSIPEIINRQNFKKFAFVFDVLPVSNPEYFFNPKNYQVSVNSFSNQIKSISKDTTIFLSSIYSKNELLKYFPEYKDNNLAVIYLGVDKNRYFKINDDFNNNKNILTQYNIPKDKKYILSLCSLNKRKNLPFLVESFVEFLDKNPQIQDLNLVLAGSKGWQVQEIFNSIENAKKYKNNIIITGFVEDNDINKIYNSAYAFVCPSLAEGFGLPVLEAMQCGIPVISSNITSLPEVYGDSALSFNPYKKDELIKCLEEIYSNVDLRNQLISKGFKQVQKFSWEKTVNDMIENYLK